MGNHPFYTKHLRDADESYFEHLVFTTRVALTLLATGIVILIHGIFPFIFVHTGSNMLCRLQEELKARKSACEDRKRQSSPSSAG